MLLTLLFLVVCAAQFLCVTLQQVTSWSRVLGRSGLCLDQVGSQAQLLFQGGSLKVGAADHSEVAVFQRSVETEDSMFERQLQWSTCIPFRIHILPTLKSMYSFAVQIKMLIIKMTTLKMIYDFFWGSLLPGQ